MRGYFYILEKINVLKVFEWLHRPEPVVHDLWAILIFFTVIDELWYNEIWHPSAEDTKVMYNLMRHVSQERYVPGANKHLGDNTLLMDLFGIHTRHSADAPFFSYNM